MKLVSIIITTYNSENFIKRTLESLLNQNGLNSLFKIEIVIVDDCSRDNTIDIVKSLNVFKIIEISNNSGGPNKGRNIGLKEANGDYICIMDHDDEWLPNRIECQLKYATLAPIVTCGFTIKRSNGETEDRINPRAMTLGYIEYKKNVTFLDKLSKTNGKQVTYIGSIMFSRELKDIFFEEYFGQVDFDWILRLFKNHNSIDIGKSLYNRYVLGTNLSLNIKYRRFDYYYSLLTIEEFEPMYPIHARKGKKRVNGSRGRFHYQCGDMRLARRYLIKSELSFKTLLYIITSFVGSKYVKQHFNSFG